MREYQIPFYELSLRLHSFHFALAVERALTKSKPLRVRQLEIALRQHIVSPGISQRDLQPWNKMIWVHFKIRLRAVGRGLDRLADETIITVSQRAGHDPIMEPSDVRPVNLQNPAASGRKKYVRQA